MGALPVPVGAGRVLKRPFIFSTQPVKASLSAETRPKSATLRRPEGTPESTELARITLRIPGDLKAEAEQAAEGQGLSLNTWFGNAVRQALRSGRNRSDDSGRTHRLRGWVQG